MNAPVRGYHLIVMSQPSMPSQAPQVPEFPFAVPAYHFTVIDVYALRLGF